MTIGVRVIHSDNICCFAHTNRGNTQIFES